MDIDYSKLYDCIGRTNKLIFLGTHFIRAFILYQYRNNLQLPEMTIDFIKIALKCLSKPSCGQAGKKNEHLEAFYKIFSDKLGITENFDAKNLSYIVNRECISLNVAYTNNIKQNFTKYLRQYVNESFEVSHIVRKSKNELTEMSKDDKNKYFIELNNKYKIRKLQLSELTKLKLDIYNDTLKCDKKYHEWLANFNKNVLPPRTRQLYDDVCMHPFKYLGTMLKMNEVLENKGYKTFQAIPLRNDLFDKYVHIDSSALKDIFTEVHSGISREEIWNKYFDLKKYKIKGYVFNQLISTDGVSVSISFMEKNEFIKKQIISANKTTASKKSKEALKNMTIEEQENYKKSKQIKRSATTQPKKTIPKKVTKKEIMNKKYGFKYIEDIAKEDKELYEHIKEKYNRNKIVVGDLGTRTIMTALRMSKERKYERFNYNRSRRIKETKRLKYAKLRQNKQNKIINAIDGCKDSLNKLTNMNKKTNKIELFFEFMKEKFKLMKLITPKRPIMNAYMNKLKWFSYINKRRHEDKLLNDIEKYYGNDTIFILGDWSNKNSPIKGLSMPNMGFRRLLSKRFEVYTLDEYKTSKINCYTGETNEHLKIPIKINKEIVLKELYPVFTYKMSNKNIGCINRDFNATINMLKIVEYVMLGKERPKELRYESSNPTVTSSVK
jgi:hypothetical protein